MVCLDHPQPVDVVKMKTLCRKSDAVKITGVPSTHIDWIWKRGLLTYKNEVGRPHRLDYNPGMLFEIYLAENLKRVGMGAADIKSALASLKRGFMGKGKNKIAFNPYSGTRQRDTDVDLVIAGAKKYLVEAKDGKRKQVWELVRDHFAASGEGKEEIEFSKYNPVAVFVRLSLLSPLIEKMFEK